ncbi:hypothetical protein ACFL6U_09575 [Planctomycetota bacterium]
MMSIVIVLFLCITGALVAQQHPSSAVVVGSSAQPSLSDDAVVPQEFYIERPTLQCAGFEWYVSGDDNHNASVTVRFREAGTSTWRAGLPLLRIQREKIWGHAQRWVYETPNMFAGSIFGLKPGTTYQCRFTMADPDGVINAPEKTVLVTTRSVPKPCDDGNVYHVYPPGYEGPREEPSFTGLNEAYYGYNGSGDWWMVAEPRVQPGDVIKVHAGLYTGKRYQYANPLGLDFHGTYVLTQDGTAERPISIVAAGDGEVIFDGDGCYRLFDVMAADHHYFEGLTIINTDIAFYAGLKRVLGCSGLSVVNCKMNKVGMGVMTHWAGSNDFYIADNTMIGTHDRTRTQGWAPWEGVEVPAPIDTYVAIKVYGQGHVICYNDIKYYHDAICLDTHGLPEGGPGQQCASIDIHNNDIFLMADDFIETDGGVHNIRVFDNRGINSFHRSLSAQTVFGGPVYFIRNICYNTAILALKFSVRPAGLIVYNNTICAESILNMISNAHFRNNLFLGQRPNQTTLSSISYTSYTSYDYNGYRNKPDADPLFVWWQPTNKLRDYTFAYQQDRPDKIHWEIYHSGAPEGTPGNAMQTFDSLAAFSDATGQERHGIMLDYDVFERVTVPDHEHPERVYQREDLDFRLRAGSAAVDAGCALPNVTDGFIGDAPDLGAWERGKPVPVYGPRTQ